MSGEPPESVPVPEVTPLEALRDAVQAFANAQGDDDDGPVLVDVAVVLWEQVRYDEDGRVMRRIRYACPTDNFSMTSGLGLIEAGGHLVRRDILDEVDE